MSPRRPLPLLWLGLLSATCLCACGEVRGGAVQLTASGEVLALGGYPFPPASADDAAFVDGWEVRFSKVLVTFDHLTLSSDPDTSVGDPSITGAAVARADGPWAIDLHAGGPLAGKGGGDEQAYPLVQLKNQTLVGGAAFDPTVRYAFGFDVVRATDSATRLQLAADDPDYAAMIQNGWTVLYVGSATWKGQGCTTTDSSFDFSQLPTAVNFRLGFASPTTYVNCQNPDNDPAQGLGDEEHARGIQVKANQAVVAQVTLHTDHPFWESFFHDSPAHFDPVAAAAVKGADGTFQVTLEQTALMSYTAFRFGTHALPWRSCLSDYQAPNGNPQMGFDSRSVPYNPAGDPTTSMRQFTDYMTYNQSTQGHLNSDGLCFVSRNYDSPP